MCIFHSSQFTFMTRNQAAQPPNIIVDTKSGGNSAPDLVSKSVVAFQANFRFFSATFLRWYSASIWLSFLTFSAVQTVCVAAPLNV
jgi:hypothetical protein